MLEKILRSCPIGLRGKSKYYIRRAFKSQILIPRIASRDPKMQISPWISSLSKRFEQISLNSSSI